MKDLQVDSYNYLLPEQLIANFPSEQRGGSKLLEFKSDGSFDDRQFKDVVDLIPDNAILVVNNTKVIAARAYGRKESGAKVEILLERILNDKDCLCHLRSNKSLKPGTKLIFGIDRGLEYLFEFVARQNNFFILRYLGNDPLLEVFDKIGHVPLPPYIQRPDQELDLSRYQTLFSNVPGAVAAPTAGLHFSAELLQAIKQRGIEIVEVTLHVGAGTFQPVAVDNILEHQMHQEYLELSATVADKIAQAKAAGRKIVAVGTTSVRTLETAALHAEQSGKIISAFAGDTDIFLYPGQKIRIVDYLITNFHLPKSTLIMLVSAFYGRENTLAAYAHAIANNYRFFSYGDACWVPNLQLNNH